MPVVGQPRGYPKPESTTLLGVNGGRASCAPTIGFRVWCSRWSAQLSIVGPCGGKMRPVGQAATTAPEVVAWAGPGRPNGQRGFPLRLGQAARDGDEFAFVAQGRPPYICREPIYLSTATWRFRSS